MKRIARSASPRPRLKVESVQMHWTGENISWARETHERLAPFAVPGAYSNYLGDDEVHARVKEAFGANFERLQSLKNRYDPANVFRYNQNIPPS